MEFGDLKKQEAKLHKATDQILIFHRNLKISLFLISGQFFIAFTVLKYTIKAGVLYFLYNKAKK